MMKKKTLFNEEDIAADEGKQLKINEQFAKKFEHNKRRELLEKGKEIYGEKALAQVSGEESSEEEDEDDDADLINATVGKKFLETIAMIRSNDPKLKQVEGELFKDEDFEDGGLVEKHSKKPLMTYKDQIRKDVLKRAEGDSDDEDDSSEGEDEQPLFNKRGAGETIAEEEQRLKKEFKKVAGGVESAESEDDFIRRKGGDSSEDEESLPEDLAAMEPQRAVNVA